jgi:hypothetical protein
MPGEFPLVVMPRSQQREYIQEMIVRLALVGPVRVIIGNNRFDAHEAARAIRRHTSQVASTLERIHLARAFTCYQMLTLLQETAGNPMPTLAVGLLETFYDENIPDFESLRILRECIWELNRLSRAVPLVVSVAPRPQREELFDNLREAAGMLMLPEDPPQPPRRQLSLWDAP